MGKWIKLFGLWLISCLSQPLIAQQTSEMDYPVIVGTMVGVGGYNLMDTYLTPGIESRYTGWGVRLRDERMRQLRRTEGRVTRQQRIDLQFAKTQNGAGSATDYGFLLNYDLGYLYQIPFASPVTWLAGASGELMGGCIYNTRNTNNPVSAKAQISLNLTTQWLYRLQIGTYPLLLRYQFDLPTIGVGFAPHYNQSYYEMFGLGNHTGIVHFQSFHNRFVMRHCFTVDLPVGSWVMRAGFLHDHYATDINSIRSHILSNTFLLGVVKKFVLIH